MTDFSSQISYPRGLRDNNPGNIRPNPAYTWYGQKGVEHNYCIFDNIEHGCRALAKDLKSKIKRGLNTFELYIPVYAPPGDNNNTRGYINRMVASTGFKPNEVLVINEATLTKLVRGHIGVEIGDHWAEVVTDQMIEDGVNMAL